MNVPWRAGLAGVSITLVAACLEGGYPARTPAGAGGEGGTGISGPCAERGRASCDGHGECRWLIPGCGERPLLYEGCFSSADCRAAGCEPGFACVEVEVDPCGGRPCAMPACGIRTHVCITPQLPCDGAGVGDDAVCRGPGGEALPVTCCMWSCDTCNVLCKRAEPVCPAGERVSVVGFCFGPCVPEDRCLPIEAELLCEATGGRWDEWACGHYRCGVPNSCEAIIPGCDCGPTSTFTAGRGCVKNEACERRCDLQQEFCIMMSSCRWYVPGCGNAPLLEAGCHPATDCREAGCEEGEVCEVVSIDPCAGLPCDACGMDMGLCLRTP